MGFSKALLMVTGMAALAANNTSQESDTCTHLQGLYLLKPLLQVEGQSSTTAL